MLARLGPLALVAFGWLLLGMSGLACPSTAEAQQRAKAVPSVVVQVKLPGASPQEVESQVIVPLESRLGLIQGAAEMTSVASEGIARIRLTLKAGTKIADLLTAVHDGVREVQETLPEASEVELRIDSGEQAAWLLFTPSETASALEAWEEVMRIVPRIERMTGVQRVEWQGHDTPATDIRLDTETLRRHMATSTFVERLEALKPPRGMEPMEFWSDALISAGDEPPLRLRDVAEISRSIPLMTGGQSDPIREGFLLSVSPVIGKAEEVRAQLERFVAQSATDEEQAGTLTLIEQGRHQLCLTKGWSPFLSAEKEREKVLHAARLLHSNPSVQSIDWNVLSGSHMAFMQVNMKEGVDHAALAIFAKWLEAEGLYPAVRFGSLPDVHWPWAANDVIVWVSRPEGPDIFDVVGTLTDKMTGEQHLIGVHPAGNAVRFGLDVQVSPEARQRSGVSLRSIARVSELILPGVILNRQDTLDRQAIVSLAHDGTGAAEKLGRLDIETQIGKRVELATVATVKDRFSVDLLRRNGQRATYITATLTTDDKPAVREKLRRLAEKFTRDGVTIDVEVR
jgi:multidrug efflux pump subunit AcrB